VVIQDHAAWSLVAGAAGDAFGAVVHGEGVAAFDVVGLLFGDDGGIEVVFGADPDAGVAVEGTHAMTVAGMGAPDLAEWIGTGRVLRFHRVDLTLLA
jgi:hypothetical protein